MSLRGKLERFRSHLTKETAPVASNLTVSEPKPAGLANLETWSGLQAQPCYFEDQYAIVREITYPIAYRHGNYSFAELHHAVGLWNENSSRHPLSAAGRAASDLLFFDTETTGLHSGAGNTIFLLGYSRVLQDHVVVKQFFLPGPEAEAALYQAFLNDVMDLTNLVTYNGKAFDWPQVKTRHTLLRGLVPQLPDFGHFDLLHGARRLWKNQLDSCRLGLVEQEVLGIRRQEDTPGYLAPMLYLNYLQDKDPGLITGILEHNELDVLSLITLYIHLSYLLLNQNKNNCSDAERFEIARWYESIGETDKAFELYLQLSDREGLESRKAKLALGNLYKGRKQWTSAIRIWEQLCEEMAYVPDDLLIELSKVYEHQVKDYEKALFYATQAYESLLSRAHLARAKPGRNRKAYLDRMDRIKHKCIRREEPSGWRGLVSE